ncbi:MAG: serine-type D-Ala-D-Ala carboxypeptidase [Gammaproteobacteria bacterium]|nr:MAG: serine-type D-Ala-D-Ala carboxypeptidase [Gammaproteobacteria bacterium]
MTRLAFVLLLAFTAFVTQAATIVPSPPQVSAKAYFLVDARSGAVLAEHNADMPLPPASLTKMMTSYVLAKEITEGRISESEMVTVSENAWSQNPVFNGSSLMWIEPGKDVSIEDLQRGIIISSGNDATVAVAEHLAGSEAVFAEMMNTNAEKLGMVDTYYVNSHGLPHPDHMTTARDLAILAKAMINDHPDQYAIYKEREFTYNNIRQYNRNTLMSEDPTVDGLKTGHTEAAGYCLVASAERRGMRLISVVMGTSSTRARKNETRSLLNYGFRFYETSTLFEPMTELEKPRIWKGQEDYVSVGLLEETVLTLPRGKKKHLVTTVAVNDELVAPLAKGDAVGTVTLSLDGETVFHAPVVALVAVEPGGFFARLWDMILMWVASIFST